MGDGTDYKPHQNSGEGDAFRGLCRNFYAVLGRNICVRKPRQNIHSTLFIPANAIL
ncbi:hypothetical protein EMIT0P100_180058 [Pseudomonas sp. IT-P100]